MDARRLVASIRRKLAIQSRRGWGINYSTVRPSDRALIPVLSGLGLEHLEAHEPWLSALCPALLRRAGAVVDVGVNIGQTLLTVKGIDRDRQYIGFEPNPRCCAYVQQLIRANAFDACTLVPAGLAARAGVARLMLSTDADSAATIVPGFRAASHHAREQTVVVVNGDEALAAVDAGAIAAIKIDVEGAELEALRGLEGTLARHRPVVVCEILPVYDVDTAVGRFRLERQRAVEALLGRLGYQMFRIGADGTVSALAAIEPHADLARTNYLFASAADAVLFAR